MNERRRQPISPRSSQMPLESFASVVAFQLLIPGRKVVNVLVLYTIRVLPSAATSGEIFQLLIRGEVDLSTYWFWSCQLPPPLDRFFNFLFLGK